MNRIQLIQLNSDLRAAIGAVAEALEFDFDEQNELTVEDLEEENDQLQEVLATTRDLANDALEDDN